MTGTDDTEVNGGFIVERDSVEVEDGQSLRSYPLNPGSTPVCCGSDALRSDADLQPTGPFTRQATVGSVKIVNAPGADADLYPPERIADLALNFTYDVMQLDITFTSPGDDYYSGNGGENPRLYF